MRLRDVKRASLKLGAALWALGLAAVPAAYADFELSDAQGKRILLKDDGTWRYVDAKPAAGADAKDTPQAELALIRRIDAPDSCTFEFVVTNTLPYEIRNIVPDFTVARANGVVYLSQNVGFEFIRPGDKRQRQLRFGGISCADIATLKVSGGDRCEMADLNRFSDAKGECLARLRVRPSELVKFEK
jgi:hypothetical protein